MHSKGHKVICYSTGTRSSETKECTRSSEDCENASRYGSPYSVHLEDGHGGGYASHSSQGLAEACSGITRLNDRARQDVAVLGLGFLKLDGITSCLNSMIYT
ncbi:hypothetical protein BHE74_00029432 [Ensete ventricosum]|nr:hypothetical protein GW17_00028738 [Ensete ventricosum]RWW63391.1 hypothetical protein BHE74_00029432 [Ensete ventricosum]